MPQSNTITFNFLKLYCFWSQSNNYLLCLVSVLKLAFSVLQFSELKNMENMICFKYGAIIHFVHFNILYETYDSILQYVHFSANSHNFHINTVMTFQIFDIYFDYNIIIYI